MIIKDNKTLKDIQEEFHGKFPFLKIEFYDQPHESGKGSPLLKTLDPGLKVGAVRTRKVTGEFRIAPEMTVAELEGRFASDYGLNLQVFRRSGNLWMQTSATDSWTLEKQNRKGGSSEASYKKMHDEE